MSRIFEFRGVKGLVAAEITKDDATGYTAGTPFSIAGTSNVTCEVENSSDTHYYDNYGAIVITSEGATTVTFETSGIPLDVYAKITGYTYDPNTGALIEGDRKVEYFAVGYQYQDTDGRNFYRYFYKGLFQIPSSTHVTMNNSTDANGQTLVFTAIRTAHEFTIGENTEGIKTMALDTSLNLVDTSTFFAQVTTPDMLVQKTAYELSTTMAANTSLTVKNVGTGATLTDGAAIYAGDLLKITVTNGTVTVNGSDFISGDIHVVAGDVAVVTTYVAPQE